MDFDYKALGENIKRLRVRRKMTQAQLAEAIAKSDSLIEQIENARGIPSLETVIDIANALDVGLDRLVCESLDSKSDFFIQEVIRRTKHLGREEMNMAMELFVSMLQVVEDHHRKK
jgi:transcriptional regulator with XRE-family HTH domain